MISRKKFLIATYTELQYHTFSEFAWKMNKKKKKKHSSPQK